MMMLGSGRVVNVKHRLTGQKKERADSLVCGIGRPESVFPDGVVKRVVVVRKCCCSGYSKCSFQERFQRI